MIIEIIPFDDCEASVTGLNFNFTTMEEPLLLNTKLIYSVSTYSYSFDNNWDTTGLIINGTLYPLFVYHYDNYEDNEKYINENLQKIKDIYIKIIEAIKNENY